MKIAGNITELIGNTPMVRINTLSKMSGAEIIGKLEFFNPLSSIKDRTAISMITDAEQKGILKNGDMIIEATSGNTGIGLAFIAASKGYRITIVMPDSLSIERRNLLEALGAKLILTPGSRGMNGAIEKAQEIMAENPGSFNPGQFKNPANPGIHFKTTANEIIEDTDGRIDIFIAGVGTGGTISGCGRALKEYNSSIKVIAVEPEGSPVLSGGIPGPHKIQGIGAGFIPEILDTSVIDEVVRITDGDAQAMTRKMAREEGLLLGISSGAALKAAEIIGSKQENSGKIIAVILPDSGERYLSTEVYS